MPLVSDKVQQPRRALVVFNTLCLYGMERSVIETFDHLRPELVPHFLIQQSNERYKTQLLCELRKRGLSFSFFSDTWDWPRVGKPQSLVHLAKLVWSLVVANCDVLRNCLRNDIIYMPAVSSVYYSSLACLCFRMLKRKAVFRFHDMVSRPSRKLNPAVWLSTDLVHCAQRSREMVSVSNPVINSRNNHVIPPCVEVREPGSLDISHWQSKRIILFAGQVSPHKGLDLLSEAVLAMAAHYDDLALHIAGGCPAEFAHWLEELLSRTAQGIEVKYWGYLNNVHDLFRAAYVYVQPSPPSRFHESFGRGVVEAMALGIPSVCYRSGALQELVVHEETGLICEQESAACLAENLSRFVDDMKFRDHCAELAKKRYAECYSDTTIRASWMELLHDRPEGCGGC